MFFLSRIERTNYLCGDCGVAQADYVFSYSSERNAPLYIEKEGQILLCKNCFEKLKKTINKFEGVNDEGVED